MTTTKNDKASIGISAAGVEKHIELVQNGLQSKVRAIMAIYNIDREEAEKVMNEILDENAGN